MENVVVLTEEPDDACDDLLLDHVDTDEVFTEVVVESGIGDHSQSETVLFDRL